MLPLLQAAAKKSDISGKSVSKAAVISMSSIFSSIQNTGVKFLADLSVPGYKISKVGNIYDITFES